MMSTSFAINHEVIIIQLVSERIIIMSSCPKIRVIYDYLLILLCTIGLICTIIINFAWDNTGVLIIIL